MNIIRVFTDARHLGRNGWVAARQLLFCFEDGRVDIRTVNGKGNTSQSGVFDLEAKQIDEICKKWLAFRSIHPDGTE